MSALGQKQTFEGPLEMSALPPKADIEVESTPRGALQRLEKAIAPDSNFETGERPVEIDASETRRSPGICRVSKTALGFLEPREPRSCHPNG